MSGTPKNINFSGIARRYEKDSLVQKTVAEILIGLLNFNGNEDMLDLGCGTGNLTRRLRERMPLRSRPTIAAWLICYSIGYIWWRALYLFTKLL